MPQHESTDGLPPLLTVGEAAAYLGLTAAEVRPYLNSAPRDVGLVRVPADADPYRRPRERPALSAPPGPGTRARPRNRSRSAAVST